jgi:toluene monooxygenase system ferredoxin subunit
MNLVQVLKRCEVFVGLGDSDLEKIAHLPSWRRNTYTAGEFVFQEDTEAKEFYILEEGEVSLMVVSQKEGTKEVVQIPVDTITTGDVFGWSALVAPHSRTMSAICVKPTSIISVRGADLVILMDDNHSLGYEVMKGLVRVIGARLRSLPSSLAGKKRLLPKKEIRLE